MRVSIGTSQVKQLDALNGEEEQINYGRDSERRRKSIFTNIQFLIVK